MESCELFSSQMMETYSKLLMQSNTMALHKMLATISSLRTEVPINPDIFVGEAAEQLMDITPKVITGPTTPSTSRIVVHSDDPIPIDEIECDVGIVVAKNFRHYLKLINADFDGSDPKEFRTMIETLCETPLYKASPKTTRVPKLLYKGGTKRKLSTSPVTQSELFGCQSENKASEEEEESQGDCKKWKQELSFNSLADGGVPESEKLNCTMNDVSIGQPEDLSLRLTVEDGLLDVTAELDKTTGKLNKFVEELNASTEQPVIRSPGEAEHDYISRRKKNLVQFSSIEAKMRFNRLKEIQRRKPKIDVDVSKLPYNGNMRRNYPAALRSVEHQLRREKNTISARISRTRNRYHEEILDKKSTETMVESINLKRKIATLRAYGNQLIDMLGMEQVDFGEMWEDFVKEKLSKDGKQKPKKESKDVGEKKTIKEETVAEGDDA